VEGAWPLVLANIQIDAFRHCAEALAARVADGGRLLLSGILREQVTECLSLFPGFILDWRMDDAEWSALALIRDS
jgi:ribosomal protein L11 methylase PrmA